MIINHSAQRAYRAHKVSQRIIFDKACHCEHFEGMRDNPFDLELSLQSIATIKRYGNQSRGATGVPPVEVKGIEG